MNFIKEKSIDIIKDLIVGAVGYSYYICLIICMLSLLAYVIGFKKGRRVAIASLITYIFAEYIGSVIR